MRSGQSHARYAGISVTALCLLVSGIVRAAPVVDQSYLVPGNQFRPGLPVTSSLQAAAQSLTVGSGGILARIDLQVGGNDAYPIRLEIGRGADPNTDIALATFDFLAPEWSSIGFYATTSIDVLASMIAVAPGDRLVLSLYSNSPTFGGWAAGNAADGSYAGGNAFSGSNAWMSPAGVDLGFRTWVETAPVAVPEPASLALVGLGVSLIAGSRRRGGRARDRIARSPAT